MRSYFLSLIKGSSWSLICGAIGKFSVAISYVILARKLEPDNYGDFSIIQSNIVLFGTFAGLGLGTTAIKLISSSNNLDEKNAILLYILKYFVLSASLVCLGITAFASELSMIFYKDSSYEYLFYAAVPLLLSSSFFSLVSSIYISFGFYALNGLNLIIQGCILLLFYLCFEQSDVERSIFYLTASFIIPLLIFICWTVKIKVWKCRSDYNKKKILITCIPITLSALLVVPTNWFITVLLSRYSPGGVIEVGLFNAATQWKNIILFVPMTLSPIMLSLLSKSHFDASVTAKLTLNVFISGVTATIVFAVIYCFSGYLTMAYGVGYPEVSSLILLYSAITILIVMNNSLGQYLIMIGKLNFGFLLNLVWAVQYLCLSWLFIDMGALGVLYALGLSYLSHSLFQVISVTFLIKNGNTNEDLHCI